VSRPFPNKTTKNTIGEAISRKKSEVVAGKKLWGTQCSGVTLWQVIDKIQKGGVADKGDQWLQVAAISEANECPSNPRRGSIAGEAPTPRGKANQQKGSGLQRALAARANMLLLAPKTDTPGGSSEGSSHGENSEENKLRRRATR